MRDEGRRTSGRSLIPHPLSPIGSDRNGNSEDETWPEETLAELAFSTGRKKLLQTSPFCSIIIVELLLSIEEYFLEEGMNDVTLTRPAPRWPRPRGWPALPPMPMNVDKRDLYPVYDEE
jgi:hypothetical protein